MSRLTAAAIFLAAPLWGQADKTKRLPTAEAARQISRIQSQLINADVLTNADQMQHERDIAKLESIASNYVIAQVEAAPDIRWWELRDRLVQLLGIKYDQRLGPDHFHELPFVFLSDPINRHGGPFVPKGPFVFSVVYNAEACNGLGCARIVVESYTLQNGKVRLAGRGGTEMNGIVGSAEGVGSDELLVQGQRTWVSGRILPYAAALYRVGEAGVKMVWQAQQPQLAANVFGGQLFVQYYDESHFTGRNTPLRLDVYSLDNGIPKLVFDHEWDEGSP